MSVFVSRLCNDSVMIDYADDVETVTNSKCSDCGDKLADWEIDVCLICETLAE